MEIDHIRFGKMLRAVRGAYSQVQVAEATGLNQQTISNLETGKSTEPTFAVICTLAKFYGITPTDMAVLAGIWTTGDTDPDDSHLGHDARVALRSAAWALQDASDPAEQKYIAGLLSGALRAYELLADHRQRVEDPLNPLPDYIKDKIVSRS